MNPLAKCVRGVKVAKAQQLGCKGTDLKTVAAGAAGVLSQSLLTTLMAGHPIEFVIHTLASCICSINKQLPARRTLVRLTQACASKTDAHQQCKQSLPRLLVITQQGNVFLGVLLLY